MLHLRIFIYLLFSIFSVHSFGAFAGAKCHDKEAINYVIQSLLSNEYSFDKTIIKAKEIYETSYVENLEHLKRLERYENHINGTVHTMEKLVQPYKVCSHFLIDFNRSIPAFLKEVNNEPSHTRLESGFELANTTNKHLLDIKTYTELVVYLRGAVDKVKESKIEIFLKMKRLERRKESG